VQNLLNDEQALLKYLQNWLLDQLNITQLTNLLHSVSPLNIALLNSAFNYELSLNFKKIVTHTLAKLNLACHLICHANHVLLIDKSINVANNLVNVLEADVDGSLELAFAMQYICKTHTLNSAIALGIVIKGESYHFEMVCQQSMQSLTQISLACQVPVVQGILTVYTEQQAKERLHLAMYYALQSVKLALQYAPKTS
jgi:6,7-dimethyl-8-ribityllumazine synthase